MAERWILDSSPIIALAHIGHTHLISALVDEAVIPEAVATEIRSGPADDLAYLWINAASIPVIKTPAPAPELSAWILVWAKPLFWRMRWHPLDGLPYWTMPQHGNAPRVFQFHSWEPWLLLCAPSSVA